jgi:hypothetical protein
MSGSVPNTISDAQMASLQRRAQQAAPPVLSDQATQHRLNSEAQRQRADQS